MAVAVMPMCENELKKTYTRTRLVWGQSLIELSLFKFSPWQISHSGYVGRATRYKVHLEGENIPMKAGRLPHRSPWKLNESEGSGASA